MGFLIGSSSKMNLTSTLAATYLDTVCPLVEDIHDRGLFVLLPFTSSWVARDRLTDSKPMLKAPNDRPR